MFCNLNFTCILHGDVGSLNLTWMLQFKMLLVDWTLFRCCNLRCCGFCCLELLELYFDVAIWDVVGFVVWSWLSYIFNFCSFTTSSFANCWTWICVSCSFSEFKHLHIQIFALWDTLGFSCFCFFIILESIVGIGIWFWNRLLRLNFKFKRFWIFYI